MIKIDHPDLIQIRDNYTSDVVNAILNRIKVIKEVISLVTRTGRTIKKSEVTGNVDGYSHALKAISNDKKLSSRKTNELLKKLEKFRKKNTVNEIARINSCLNEFNTAYLTEIISSEPVGLKTIQQDFFNAHPLVDKNDLLIKYLFDYDFYYEKHIVSIAIELDISVCPYCNRNFITHIQKGSKRIIGPTFDHYFHQAENPLLTLSFYNLIPSCTPCNSSLKNQKEFDLEYNIHPYFNELGNSGEFDFRISQNKKNGKKNFIPFLKIVASTNSDEYKRLKTTNNRLSSGSLDVFKIEEIYKSHADIVEEVYEKFDKNSPHYIKSLATQIKSLGTTEEEFYRFHFGNYFDCKEFNKRPLSRFTKDIYTQLKRIEPLY